MPEFLFKQPFASIASGEADILSCLNMAECYQKPHTFRQGRKKKSKEKPKHLFHVQLIWSCGQAGSLQLLFSWIGVLSEINMLKALLENSHGSPWGILRAVGHIHTSFRQVPSPHLQHCLPTIHTGPCPFPVPREDKSISPSSRRGQERIQLRGSTSQTKKVDRLQFT